MQTAENMTDRYALARAADQISVTTREELEAACWHNWPTGTPGAAAAIEAILRATDDYATCQATAVLAGDGPVLQAHRRAVLELATRREETRVKRNLAPCGTWAAYRRHLRRYEPVDDACRKAASAYVTARRAARKAAQATGTPGGTA
jgi:hypothetical protein